MSKKKHKNIEKNVADFTISDQTGDNFNLYEVLKEKRVLIFFYPKDFTPGCTTEVCAFGNMYDAFILHNIEVVGISNDDEQSHQIFHAKYQLPYRLLSDPKGKIRKQFGVKSKLFVIPGRETFIINQDGKVVFHYDSLTKADTHIEEALAFLNNETTK